MPKYALRNVVSEFNKGRYRKIIAVGTISNESSETRLVKEYFATNALQELGIQPESIIAAPYPTANQDRTYHASLAVKGLLKDLPERVNCIDLITLGAHARRSRFIYQRSLGEEFKVGVISIPSQDFDESRWWDSSEGFRTIIGEAIAFLYTISVFNSEMVFGGLKNSPRNVADANP